MAIEFKHPHFSNKVITRRQPDLREEVAAAGVRYAELQAAGKVDADHAHKRADIIAKKSAQEKRSHRRKRRNRVIRRVAAIISAAAIIVAFVATVSPTTGKTAYALRQIKSDTVAVAIDTSFDAEVNVEIAEGAIQRADAQRKVTELENIFTLAESKLGCKYVHATAGPTTFDCQGFVHYIFTHCDANVLCYVPRGGCLNQYNAVKQFQVSTNPYDAKRGDIIYFWGGGRCKHVGIALGNGKLIHATTIGPGRSCVKITDIPRCFSKYAVCRVIG